MTNETTLLALLESQEAEANANAAHGESGGNRVVTAPRATRAMLRPRV